MALHIIKLCVGAETLKDLADWQAHQVKTLKRRAPVCGTRMWPKRADDVLKGGSLYWVIKGVIQVRQRIIGFDTGHKEDGSACCLILLDRNIVPVRPVKRRAFQGWRYLTAQDAPADIGSASHAAALAELTPKMRKDLADLGLL